MQVLVSEEHLQDVGAAIREKNRLTTEYLPNEFGIAIRALPTDGATPLEELTVTENGEYTPQAGYGGFSKVTVDVPQLVYTATSYSARAASTGTLDSGNASANFSWAMAWDAIAGKVD